MALDTKLACFAKKMCFVSLSLHRSLLFTQHIFFAQHQKPHTNCTKSVRTAQLYTPQPITSVCVHMSF